MLRQYLILAFCLIGFLVLSVLRQEKGAAALTQEPGHITSEGSGLKFSHRFHAEAGILCVDCHGGATTSVKSADRIGTAHEACASCHEQQLDSECGYCHTNPESIQEVVPTERELIFSHVAHTEVACQTCHLDVDKSDDLAGLALPEMGTCYSCHNNLSESNTCELCHSDFVTLLPNDHKKSDFLKTHRETIRLGGLEQRCQTCHTETFCQDCHQGAGLKAFGEGNLMSDPIPRTSVRDMSDQLKLQNIHDLNYRFNHAIDARSKASECSSCHEAQTFCAECHTAGGNINQVSFRPASHDVAGFTTLGRGSGGGLHAEEAERDMESCISCHDVEGQDPVCLTCHTDGGGVR